MSVDEVSAIISLIFLWILERDYRKFKKLMEEQQNGNRP